MKCWKMTLKKYDIFKRLLVYHSRATLKKKLALFCLENQRETEKVHFVRALYIYLEIIMPVSVKPESLAQKQNIDSRQASGDIARLAGCRLCNASEPPKRMLFDTALLKTLLGRDSITCRQFVPKGIFICA